MFVEGEDEITPLLNDAGNIVGYHCNLCDCTTTDSSGRLSHLKGRKHRAAYKVSHSLVSICCLCDMLYFVLKS